MIREMVRCGELTERGLARATGVSQPHVHNVLKGIRTLSPEFADQLLQQLSLTLADLCSDSEPGKGPQPLDAYAFHAVPMLRGRTGPRQFPFTPERHEGVYPFPRMQVTMLTDPVVLAIHHDDSMAPRFQEGDLILLERSEHARLNPDPESAYVVDTSEGTAVRYIRYGGRSIYLLTEKSKQDQHEWEYLPLSGRNILEVVRGQVVWIGRRMEAAPTDRRLRF